MIDIHTERIISFHDAAKSFPGRPNLSTLHRWRLAGVRGVRLETLLIGGRRVTSAEALQRFAEATTAAADGSGMFTLSRTSRQRQRDIERAEAELERAGISSRDGRSKQVRKD